MKKDLDKYDKLLNEYFESNYLDHDTIKALFIIYNTTSKLIVLDETGWRDAKKTEILELEVSMKKIKDIDDYNTYIGFMYPFKKNEIVFKIKNILIKRSKGARCDQAPKYSQFGSVNILNKILEKEVFTEKNTKDVYSLELCIYLELLLRHYQDIKYKNKTWFMYPELAILLKIEKYQKLN